MMEVGLFWAVFCGGEYGFDNKFGWWVQFQDQSLTAQVGHNSCFLSQSFLVYKMKIMLSSSWGCHKTEKTLCKAGHSHLVSVSLLLYLKQRQKSSNLWKRLNIYFILGSSFISQVGLNYASVTNHLKISVIYKNKSLLFIDATSSLKVTCIFILCHGSRSMEQPLSGTY